MDTPHPSPSADTVIGAVYYNILSKKLIFPNIAFIYNNIWIVENCPMILMVKIQKKKILYRLYISS